MQKTEIGHNSMGNEFDEHLSNLDQRLRVAMRRRSGLSSPCCLNTGIGAARGNRRAGIFPPRLRPF